MWHKALKWQHQASSEGLSTPKCFKPLYYTAGPSRLQAGKKRICIHCKSKLACGLSISGSPYFLRVARNLDFCMKSVKFLLKLFFFCLFVQGPAKNTSDKCGPGAPQFAVSTALLPHSNVPRQPDKLLPWHTFLLASGRNAYRSPQTACCPAPPGKGLQLPASLSCKTDLQNKDSSYQSFPIELIQFTFIKTSWLYV